ncbi:hypothetical protein OPV22_021174 [Ensete ventricosum]|uniref:Uncharacterized protein n=1 Tax=Ensete ventricosum TaxID=4639 RepID=A0AAV8QGJ0_ENSVE|nr:hypothetical protein OPV22_021174 [Ensete ventricosum]
MSTSQPSLLLLVGMEEAFWPIIAAGAFGSEAGIDRHHCHGPGMESKLLSCPIDVFHSVACQLSLLGSLSF